MMNDSITLADWHTFHQLDSGIYGYMAGDATRPENPALTMATPRIVTLNPGQVIFRWCHSGMPVPTASPWWATKRGAQAILRKSAGGDTAEAARAASNVARSWNSDLGNVVFATVIGAGVKAFLGMGRAIWDAQTRESWDSKQLQLYVPNMSVAGPAGRTMSPDALRHF